ncbi:hypothetical protein RQP46_005017 [Phenoliferia psychrophenolica]
MMSYLKQAFCKLLSFIHLSSRPKLTLHAEPTTLTFLDPKTGERHSTRLDTIISRCKSLTDYYTPTWWLASGHLATIYCTLADFSYDSCDYSRRLIQVPDGGSLALDFTPKITESDPIDSRPILVVLHGLTGGSHESYVVDILSKITKPKDPKNPDGPGLGWRGCVVNFRGCAGAPVTSKKLYHGGYTDDLRGHYYLSSSYLQLVYSRAMAKNLQRVVTRNRAAFEKTDVDFEALFENPNQTLYEFDSLATRVLGGFKSTEAYYRYASADQYALGVAVPLLSLSSIDDPIIPATSIPRSLAAENPNLVFATTEHGGHLGWWSGLFRPRRWVSKPVCEFLREVERADPSPRKHAETKPAQRDGKIPEIGDEMVTVVGREDVGFAEVATGAVESSGPQADDGLIKGL